MISVFISYSHSDEDMRKELEKHLSILRRQGVINTWHDRLIGAGEDIHGQINDHLNSADIILLLVSTDFLASDYCYDIEMKRAIERHHEGEARVIPVILRPCDWHGAPFGGLNAVPTDGKPINEHKTLDHGFLEVAQAMRQVVKSLGDTTTSAVLTLGMNTAKTYSPTEIFPQPSYLRIKKEFTDLDRHEFLTDALNYIARYFENSLRKLQSQNDNVKTKFQQIDANTFEAIAFANGSEKSRCSISLGSLGMPGIHQIFFSYGRPSIGSANGFNEAMSVSNDGSSLYLKPMGMPYLVREKKSMLTQQEAAEYYWRLFMEKLR